MEDNKKGSKWFEQEKSPYKQLSEYGLMVENDEVIHDNVVNSLLKIWFDSQKETIGNKKELDRLNRQFHDVFTFILFDLDSFLQELSLLSQSANNDYSDGDLPKKYFSPEFYSEQIHFVYRDLQNGVVPNKFPPLEYRNESLRKKLIDFFYRKEMASLHFKRGVAFFYLSKHFDCIADMNSCTSDQSLIYTETDYFSRVFMESSYIATGYYSRGMKIGEENISHEIFDLLEKDEDEQTKLNMMIASEKRLQLAQDGRFRREAGEEEFEQIKREQFTVKFPEDYTYEVYVNNVNNLFHTFTDIRVPVPVKHSSDYFEQLVKETSDEDKLEMVDHPIRGRCVVAKENFYIGDSVAQISVPFVHIVSTEPESTSRFCSFCGNFLDVSDEKIISCETCESFFCSRDCKELADVSFHSDWGCNAIAALSSNVIESKSEMYPGENFLLLAKVYGNIMQEWKENSICEDPFESVSFLKHIPFYQDFKTVFLLRELEKFLEFQELTELHKTPLAGWLIYDELRNVCRTSGFVFHEDGEVSGTGVGGVLSYFNHSCTPNVEISFDPKLGSKFVQVHALDNIEPGDELNISYIEPSRFDYQRELKKVYGIDCPCISCDNGMTLERMEKMYNDRQLINAGFTSSSVIKKSCKWILRNVRKLIKR